MYTLRGIPPKLRRQPIRTVNAKIVALSTSPVYEEEALPEAFMNGHVDFEPNKIRQAKAHLT